MGGQEWVDTKGGCIKLLHFTYTTFSWVANHDCFIDYGQRQYNDLLYCDENDEFSNILSLLSTTFFDKNGQLNILLLAHEDFTYQKMYLIDYNSQTWRQLDSSFIKSRMISTLFTIRNQVFVMIFHQAEIDRHICSCPSILGFHQVQKVELYHVLENGTKRLQEFQDFPLSTFVDCGSRNTHSIMTQPFYG